MNNSTHGDSASQPCAIILDSDLAVIDHVINLMIQLPVNVYILLLIISKHWITSEFYPLTVALYEILICVHETLGVLTAFFTDPHLMKTRRFFLGFITTGRPSVLVVICVERYLAVVKPVVFLRLKALKYKLVVSGIIWLLTMVFCWSWSSICVSYEFHYTVVVLMSVSCVVTLYCCIATLLVLKQPGPGEGIRQREGMGSAKQKAFWIIFIITVSVFVTYTPLMVVIVLKEYMALQTFLQLVRVSYTFTAFSGFGQSLLFLQRSRQLPCMKWP